MSGRNDHKHCLTDEYKQRSKNDYHRKHKPKEDKRPKKHGGYKKKARPRAMVADASDVDTSSSYTTSSSSEEEDGGRYKEKRHMNRNFNGLSCIATNNNYCTMAHCFDDKNKKDDSDCDS